MILTRKSILNEIKSKNIVITPFQKKNIGPASIDLTLSNEFRIFKGHKKITLNENSDYKKYTKKVIKNEIEIEPNGYILGITKERIKLPDNILGELTGRSRFARFGIGIHVSASFISPGINNCQVLEIKNESQYTIILKKGLKICQLVLERTEGHAICNSKFKNQTQL